MTEQDKKDQNLKTEAGIMHKNEIFEKMKIDPGNHELWETLRTELRRWANSNNIGPVPHAALFSIFHRIHISTHCPKSHK